ncbi:MAG: histone deacetylase [Myxococcaceae bacterium]|nr:histone deacetylase [Myxococcaceae bacterium]MCI0669032.1 histone deacetylase [Myxococcaceae bacterium]
MSTLLYWDPLFARHDPGVGHPESPARAEAILALLRQEPVEGLVLRSPRPATFEELARVHTLAHLRMLEDLRGRSVALDEDTLTSPDSVDAAMLAAGAAVGAVEAVLRGEAPHAFALVRPPGHHAEPDRAMGFCLLNNVAVAAEAARALGARRVLVVDWDVHHGNGTQAAFWERRDVLYQSVHQFPYYPGTGEVLEIGAGEGRGYTVNVPLPAACGDSDYGAVFEELLLPIGRAYRPDLVLVSAGFDPHQDDPIGGMRVTERGFAAMCTSVRELAAETCGGKLVLVLEGGYTLGGLARSVHACLEVLEGRTEHFPGGQVGRSTREALKQSREALLPFWPTL